MNAMTEITRIYYAIIQIPIYLIVTTTVPLWFVACRVQGGEGRATAACRTASARTGTPLNGWHALLRAKDICPLPTGDLALVLACKVEGDVGRG